MELLLEKMIENSITVSGIIALVLAARLLLKKAPRSFSYALWFLVLIRILCPVTVQGIYTILPEQVESNVNSTVSMLQETPTEWMKQKVVPMDGFSGKAEKEAASVSSENGKVDSENDTVYSDNKKSTTADGSTETFVWNLREHGEQAFPTNISLYDIFGCIWAGGIILLTIYLIVNMILAHRRLRDAIPIGNNVYKSDAVANSLVCGLLHPHIYVNPGICQTNMNCIMEHEKCHIRRLDYIVKPMAFLIFSLNWFNPMVWVAYWLMMKDMEMSCDEKVMKKLGGSAKKEYSYLLLTMAQKQERRFQQTPAFGGMIVKQRIRNVLSYKRPAALTLVIAVLVIGVCGCSVFSSPGETEENTGITSRADKETHYVEQKISLPCDNGALYGTSKEIVHSMQTGHLQDMDGNMYFFSNVLGIKKNTYYEGTPLALRFDGETTKKVELPWGEEVVKYANKKGMYIQDRFFGRDGKLYQSYAVYNRRYRSDETDKSREALYQVEVCLIQIDMKTNEWKEISLPKMPERRSGKGIVHPVITVLKSGNLIITNFSGICGIYSPEGKKLQDLENGKYYLPGDGEYFAITYDKKYKSKSIEVYREDTGEKKNELMLTDVQEGLSDKEQARFCYESGCFYIVCSKGIYRAETDAKEFTLVVDPVRDKTFTLGKAENYPQAMYIDVDKEEFYVVFYSETLSESHEFICSYKKREE